MPVCRRIQGNERASLERKSMTDLIKKHCEPCEKGTPPLSGKELEQMEAQIKGWKTVGGKQLEKEYRFKDFASALAFVNRLGAVADRENHHPDLELGWGRVKVSLSTHSIGGLSENDFILAAHADEVLAA
jgi:4a-hydroxytetrahydrobiopterin dehydratase